MSCGHISRLISAYLDSELSGRDMLAVREHIRDCARCAAELEDTRLLKSLMSRLPAVRPSVHMEARLLAALDVRMASPRERLSFWTQQHLAPHLQPAAAAVFVTAALLLAVLGRLPQPVPNSSAPVFANIPGAHGTLLPASVSSVGTHWSPEPAAWRQTAEAGAITLQPVTSVEYAGLVSGQ